MNERIKNFGGILNVGIFVGMILFISSCSMEKLPVVPNEDKALKKIKILKFKNVKPSLKKTITVSQAISADEGGILVLNHTLDDEGLVYANISFEVLPNTISEDTEITLVLDDVSLELHFTPAGLTFGQPAILNIYAMGLNLEGINPNAIRVYYDNPESGQWEEMENEAVTVNILTGYVNVQNVKIPHFSKYVVTSD
ncbi:hypothetical protein IIC38_13485 [candidate division KSB1 bacterium]|nr:hypothetical protein [candidate division KSB1 bacterium]